MLLLRCFFRLIHNLRFFFYFLCFRLLLLLFSLLVLLLFWLLINSRLFLRFFLPFLTSGCACGFSSFGFFYFLFLFLFLFVLFILLLFSLFLLRFFFRFRFIFFSSCFATSSCFGSTFFSGFTAASSHPASNPSESSKEINHFILLMLSPHIKKLGAIAPNFVKLLYVSIIHMQKQYIIHPYLLLSLHYEKMLLFLVVCYHFRIFIFNRFVIHNNF